MSVLDRLPDPLPYRVSGCPSSDPWMGCLSRNLRNFLRALESPSLWNVHFWIILSASVERSLSSMNWGAPHVVRWVLENSADEGVTLSSK